MYDRDEARQLLEDELTGPEYQREFTGPVREAIDAVLQWLQEEALSLGVVNIPAGPLVVLVLLVAVTGVLLVVRPRLQRSGSGELSVDIEAGLSAEDLRDRADLHAQAGNYDDAARDRFRALVRGAEQRGLLSSAEGRTATEITRQLAAKFGEHAEQLGTAAELFNLSRYGSQRLTGQHYEQLRAVDRELASAQPTGPAAQRGPTVEVPR